MYRDYSPVVSLICRLLPGWVSLSEYRRVNFAERYSFERGKQVLNLAGLDLSANRSGKRSEMVTPVISKKGKAELRYALYQAALIASSSNRYFIEYYTDKLRGREREKGIRTKMRVKLGAKMLVIAWTLMKKKELFNPDYLKS